MEKEVVKKDVYHELIKKPNAIHTTHTSNLVKKAVHNTKTDEILRKVLNHDHDEYLTTQELRI